MQQGQRFGDSWNYLEVPINRVQISIQVQLCTICICKPVTNFAVEEEPHYHKKILRYLLLQSMQCF